MSGAGSSPARSGPSRAEVLLDVYGFLSRGYFYVPVLIPYLQNQLADVPGGATHAASMSVLALFAVGISLAEYPSGVFADWAGRSRALMVSGVVYAAGALVMLAGDSVLELSLAQLLLGIGVAFRSGADAALLHAVLESQGEVARYGAALARMRFWNLAGIAVSGLAGGWMYGFDPAYAFAATALASVVCVVPLLGFREPADAAETRRFTDVVGESLRLARRDRPVGALILQGGIGTVFFTFAYWSTQTFLSERGVSATWMGVVVTAIPLLQAATMSISAWIAADARRRVPALFGLLTVVPTAFVVASVSDARGWLVPGAIAFIVSACWAIAYRNLVNVRMQELVPDRVRASLLSLESWTGAVTYTLFFPLAGWVIDGAGTAAGWLWIAAAMAAANLSLGALAFTRGAWAREGDALSRQSG